MSAGEEQTEHRRRQKPGRSKSKAANPLRSALQADIDDLLLRFFLSSPRGLSSLSFDGFKECWLTQDKHFTLIHYTFATSRVDYARLLQTMFQVTLSFLDRVPVKKLQDLAPETYGRDEVDFSLLSAAWNMSVVFCLYCIHGTQFEVDFQDSKSSNKSHMEVLTHSELEEKTPIRISMSMYMRLIITANLQFSHFVNTHVGRCTFAILDHLKSTNAFCFSAFTGPVLHEEFDEAPGNSSNHIIEAFNLEEIWTLMKKEYSKLMKKHELIGVTFVDCPRAASTSGERVNKTQEREVTVNSPAKKLPKVLDKGKPAPSGPREHMFVGFKRSQVREVSRNTAIQKARREKTSMGVEHVVATVETAAAMGLESTQEPEVTMKSSEALAEELAAMFDAPSSSVDATNTPQPPRIASHSDDHEAYITELTRLERETDEVLKVAAKEDSAIVRRRNENTSKRATSQANRKHADSKPHTTRKRRGAPARSDIDLLKGLEQNLQDILEM